MHGTNIHTSDRSRPRYTDHIDHIDNDLDNVDHIDHIDHILIYITYDI